MNCPFPVIQCNKCKSILIACSKNFHKAKRCKYGFRPQCKVCRNKENKIYREENKDEINKRRKIYREENKEIISERDKKYRINNKEKVRIRKHKYYINNSEYIKNKFKNWHKNNPEKVFNSHSKRREKEENQGNGFTKEQWKEMMDFFEWKCAYSGEYLGGDSDKRSIDHIVPLNNNGEHEIWNLVPMHFNYNSSKRDKNMLDWYMQQDYFDIDRLIKIYEWRIYAFNKWS